MAPSSSIQQILLSPAELSYLHTSLSQTPPIRPDARSATQFRPLLAEFDILPGTNGSARICFADGTEAIVGVKAEVEKSPKIYGDERTAAEAEDIEDDENDLQEQEQESARFESCWVELTVEIPGFRDDDAMPVFLAALLSEALLADRELTRRLWINRRFHWKLFIDVSPSMPCNDIRDWSLKFKNRQILLLSTPLSYPLPLLSLTAHLALLSTRLPRLKSELDEDPLFDDDWDASVFLYPRAGGGGSSSSNSRSGKSEVRPPITLLVISVGDNIIFDPSREELAVAEVVLAVSVGKQVPRRHAEAVDIDGDFEQGYWHLKLLAVRTIDPPSRLTPLGLPNFLNSATGGTAEMATPGMDVQRNGKEMEGVWQTRRGGARRKMIGAMVGKVLQSGGVAQEVFDGLDGVDLG
ncbi:MAG: hypothetical protein M1818_005395 [Claussenomyces sp. TS43310]|nr:MAG: hypothetical protein M1818_005395 [Claussenomyces sp. TS43310]